MELTPVKRDVLSAELILISLKVDAINAIIHNHPHLVSERAVLLHQSDRLSVLLKESTIAGESFDRLMWKYYNEPTFRKFVDSHVANALLRAERSR